MANSNKVWVISYGQLGLIVAVFAVGVITALLLVGGNAKPPTTFTTTELIGFALSVVLSGASIVLAIAAIGLGRFSEQAIIQRSDESIRLQNEVFAKTTDALQRIESSTGVTEKRIEDIISGRVGDISHTIAEIAAKGSGKGQIAKADLEQEIKDSIMKSLQFETVKASSELRANEREKERRQRAEEREKEEAKYQVFHERAMIAIANKNGVKIEKVPTHGTISQTGDAFFDAIFRFEDLRIGALSFRNDTSGLAVKAAVLGALAEMKRGVVDLMIFVVAQPNAEVIAAINDSRDVVSDEYKEKVYFASCSEDPEAIIDALTISRDGFKLEL